jgi:hypothetical protein
VLKVRVRIPVLAPQRVTKAALNISARKGVRMKPLPPFLQALLEAVLILTALFAFNAMYGRAFNIIVTDGSTALMGVMAIAYIAVRATILERSRQ